MEKQEVKLTMKELNRYEIIKRVIDKIITLKEASMLLRLGYRQSKRVKKRYILHGVKGIERQPGSGRKGISEQTKNKIISLYKIKYGKTIPPINTLHFNEKLEEDHNIIISYETLRKLLIRTELKTRKKRKIRHRKKRARMPEKGLMLQMDTSTHRWIPVIPKEVPLISVVDDCTSGILFAQFFDSDSTFNNMDGIKKVVKKHGWFKALYHDKASHFYTTRKGGTWNNTRIEQDDTNIEKALDELGIISINANSPQAKGRVERSYRTFQDRLIVEMQLHNIKTYKEANIFINDYFLDYYNDRFAVNKNALSAFCELKDVDLELIFTKRVLRKVKKDNTVSFFTNIIQIPGHKGLSLIRATVEIRWNQNNDMWILYKNRVVYKNKLPRKYIYKEKKVEQFLAKRIPIYA